MAIEGVWGMEYTEEEIGLLCKMMSGIPCTNKSNTIEYYTDGFIEALSKKRGYPLCLQTAIGAYVIPMHGFEDVEEKDLQFFKILQIAMSNSLDEIIFCVSKTHQEIINAVIAWRYKVGK